MLLSTRLEIEKSGVLASGREQLKDLLRFFYNRGAGDDDFLNGMFDRIDEEFTWHEWTDFCYRFGGRGGFKGSHISIHWIDKEKDLYFLEISPLEYSPYEDIDIEGFLSHEQNVPYGIFSAKVAIEFAREGDRFSIDFSQIVSCLKSALAEVEPECVSRDGAELAAEFAGAERLTHPMHFFEGKRFTVSLSLGGVPGPYADCGNELLWKAQGAHLSGPVYGSLPESLQAPWRNPSAEAKKYNPEVHIAILGSRIHQKYLRLPMFDAADKIAAVELAGNIEKAFVDW